MGIIVVQYGMGVVARLEIMVESTQERGEELKKMQGGTKVGDC